MKKLFVIICLVFITFSVSAQSGGTGISSDPYWGDISSSPVWSLGTYPGNTVYVGTPANPDLRVITNGHLTIDPGITVVFKELGSDLIITGTGQLTAGGAGSAVTFTKDASKSYRGHISFQTMDVSADISTMNNCVIEYGDVKSTLLTPANPNQYGGAVHADFSSLVISNCEIRNNKAGWGGGIFVGNGKYPSISNCYLHDNTATTSGGGIYFWTGSYSTVTNCLITYNSCTGSGGGGGIFLGGQAKNVNVINSVISHNSANSQSLGHNIKFFNNTNSPKPKFINSIIWYPSNSIVYVTSAASSTDFVNCGIQDPNITYTNCIALNATNTNPAGPNFNDPDLPGLDWSITFISPCRDKGVNSYTGVTIPSTDYIGNSTIGTKDIGAYEVQYSRWTGATSDLWGTATNWQASVDPATGTGDVVIPTGATNYPTGSTTQDFTIGSGKQMIVEQGARVTLRDLTNNGILKLNATSAGFASLIINSYSRGTGATEEIQLYLTGGGSVFLEDYKWHYISSPVTSLSTNTFTGVTFDLAQFIESRPALSLLQGWVAYDGYVYSTGVKNGPTFSSLTPGKGYNFWDNNNNTFTFGGLFNTSNAVMSLSYSGVPSLHGFNLLGNPFSSGLNWDDIANSVYYTYPANTSKGVYFTRNNIQCTYIGGVGTPGDVRGIIPPMQGFFTKTYSTGNTITIPALARTQNAIHPTYKGSSVIPLVRLMLQRDSVTSDETVVRFDDLAKSDLDNDFDAVKMFISATRTQIYSSAGGTNYAINGQPYPETFVEIPIVFNSTKDTIYTISATQLQGLDNYDVTLKDNTTGFIADLKTTRDVTFSAGPGTITDRFVLKISAITTGIDIPAGSKNMFNIYHANNVINIQTITDEWDGKSGSVKVLDLTGKTVTSLQDAEFSRNSVIQVPGVGAKGMYVVEIRSGVKRYVGKVVIK